MNTKIKYLIHIIFWIIVYAVSHRMLNVDYGESKINYYYTALFLIPNMIGFYIATIGLRTFISKPSYLAIISSIMLGGLVGVFGNTLLINHLSDWIFPGYYMVSFHPLADLAQIVSLFLFIAILIFLAFNRFDLQEQKTQTVQEKNLIQMKAMESKIQPHFLFNSLNNIYSSIDSSNQKAKDYLMKLSDSMRYMIYDVDADLVPLEQELEYIKNYIGLEKLRFDDAADISLNIKGGKLAFMIAPLVLIPLVENCFKHVDKSNPQIDINIDIDQDQLRLKTENSFTVNDDIIKHSGVGMVTLKSRLQLLYPNKHKIVMKQDDVFFTANLTLDLSL